MKINKLTMSIFAAIVGSGSAFATEDVIVVKSGDTADSIAHKNVKKHSGGTDSNRQVRCYINSMYKHGLNEPGFIYPGQKATALVDDINKGSCKAEWIGGNLSKHSLDTLRRKKLYTQVVEGSAREVVNIPLNASLNIVHSGISNQLINVWFQLFTGRTNYSERYLNLVDVAKWKEFIQSKLLESNKGVDLKASLSKLNSLGTSYSPVKTDLLFWSIDNSSALTEPFYILTNKRGYDSAFSVIDGDEKNYCILSDAIPYLDIDRNELKKNVKEVSASGMPCYRLKDLGAFNFDINNGTYDYYPRHQLSKMEVLASELNPRAEKLNLAENTAVWLNNGLSVNYSGGDVSFNSLSSELNLGTKYGVFSTSGYLSENGHYELGKLSYKHVYDGIGFNINTSLASADFGDINFTVNGNGNLLEQKDYDFSKLDSINVDGPGIIELYDGNRLLRTDKFTSNRVSLSAYRGQLTQSKYIVIIDRFKNRREIHFNDMQQHIQEGFNWSVGGSSGNEDQLNTSVSYQYKDLSSSLALGYGDDMSAGVTVAGRYSDVYMSTSLNYSNNKTIGNINVNTRLFGGLPLYVNYKYGDLSGYDTLYEFGTNYQFSSIPLSPSASLVSSMTVNHKLRTTLSASASLNSYSSIGLSSSWSDSEVNAYITLTISGDNRASGYNTNYGIGLSRSISSVKNRLADTQINGNAGLESRYFNATAGISGNLGAPNQSGYAKIETAIAYAGGHIGITRPISGSLGIIEIPDLEDSIELHTPDLTFSTSGTTFMPINPESKNMVSVSSDTLVSLDGAQLDLASFSNMADIQKLNVVSDGMMLTLKDADKYKTETMKIKVAGKVYKYYDDMGFFIENLPANDYDYSIVQRVAGVEKILKKGRIHLRPSFSSEEIAI